MKPKIKTRGGKRKGAGRKPSGNVRVVAQVKAATAAEINRRAAGGKIGPVIDALIFP